jgi:hypothetical protein
LEYEAKRSGDGAYLFEREALRQAIEQAEKPNLKQVIYLYDEPQMEMPKQEPMPCKKLCDWCVNSGYDFCRNAAKTTPIPNPQPQFGDTSAAYMVGVQDGKKQREWVGLTDAEKQSVCRVGSVYAPDGVVTRRPLEYRQELEGVAFRAVRQAEAKLKDKNTP